MLLFSFLVAILGSIALFIAPAFAQAPVSPFATSPGISSGISTLDTRAPSSSRNTSLRLPSCDGVSRSTSGSRETTRAASVARNSFGRSVMASRSTTPLR